MNEKITVDTILKAKAKGRKIVCLTAYDYSFAKVFDRAGVDIILVGDSLGMVLYGEDSTKTVTMEDMVRHTRAVARGVSRALVVSDMPIDSYATAKTAVINAKMLLQAGAHAIKIEGDENNSDIMSALREEGVAVMGHVGLTPQTITAYKVQGKSKDDAARIFKQACHLAEAGVFAIVLECIPKQLAARISREVQVPTIGIGAGAAVDGQVLVNYDMLGIYEGFLPKFVRQFAHINELAEKATGQFIKAVTSGDFPSDDESFSMDDENIPE